MATEELGQYDEAEDDPGDEEVDVEHPAEEEEVRGDNTERTTNQLNVKEEKASIALPQAVITSSGR